MSQSTTTAGPNFRPAVAANSSSLRSRAGELLALGFGLAGPRLITLITLPVAYALMGATAVGRLALIEAATIYIPVVGGMAFATYAQRFVATREPGRLVEVWQSSITVVLALSTLSAVITVVWQPPDTGLWLCGIFAAALQGMLPTWILRGARNFRDYPRASIAQVAVASTTILIGLVVHWLPAYFLGNITGYLAVLWICKRNGIVFRPRCDSAIIRRASIFMPSQAAIQVYVSVDVIIVRLFLGLAAAGLYATMYRVQYVVMAIYAVIQQFLLPRLRGLAGRMELNVNRMLWAGAFAFQALGVLAIVCLHNITSGPFSRHWYVPAILLSQGAIATIGVIPVMVALTTKSRRYALVMVTGAAVNILVNCALIPWAGLAGAALATCVSEMTVITLAALATNRMTLARLAVTAGILLLPIGIFTSTVIS